MRGRVIPVINLTRSLGLGDFQATDASRILVTELGHLVAGLLVDSVTEVLEVEESQMEPMAQIGHLHAEEVQGIAKTGERLIAVLRPENLLNGNAAQCI